MYISLVRILPLVFCMQSKELTIVRYRLLSGWYGGFLIGVSMLFVVF